MSELAHVDGLVPRPPHYHSYLLRFWEERGETDTARIWRFMLQDPSTEERFGFADLDAMVLWIHDKTTFQSDIPLPDEKRSTQEADLPEPGLPQVSQGGG